LQYFITLIPNNLRGLRNDERVLCCFKIGYVMRAKSTMNHVTHSHDKHYKTGIKLELAMCLIKHHVMKTYRGVNRKLRRFLSTAIGGGEFMSELML
jgi:hypothetical protein